MLPCDPFASYDIFLLGKDKGQEELLDRIAHHYQVENITEQLSMSNWCIESTVTENGKTVMEIVQY